MSKIYTLGPDGSYSSIIAKEVNVELGFDLEYCSSIKDVINSSVQDFYGIIPIDNRYGGIVQPSMETLYENKNLIHILGIVKLQINHCLASGNGEKNIGELNKVYSHPQALKQCNKFLNSINIETIESNSTTEKIDNLKYGESIICSQYSAEKSGLNIMKTDIAPDDNMTRFALISNKENARKIDLSNTKLLDLNLGMFIFEDLKQFHPILLDAIINGGTNDGFIYPHVTKNGNYNYIALLRAKLDNFIYFTYSFSQIGKI